MVLIFTYVECVVIDSCVFGLSECCLSFISGVFGIIFVSTTGMNEYNPLFCYILIPLGHVHKCFIHEYRGSL